MVPPVLACSPSAGAKPTGSACDGARAARTVSSTAAGSAPGWTCTCQSTATSRDGAGGHGRLRGGEERAEARQQRHRDRHPGRRGGEPRRPAGAPGPRSQSRDHRGVRSGRGPASTQRAVAPSASGRVEPRGDGRVVGRRRPAPRRARRPPSQQHRHTRSRGVPVELAGGLVGEDQPRAAGQHPRDGDPLGLAAGQLLGQRVGQLPERQPVQRGARPARRASASRDPGEQQRQRHVLERRPAPGSGWAPGTPRPTGPGRPAAAAQAGPATAPAGRACPGRPAGAAASTCPTPTARSARSACPAAPRSRPRAPRDRDRAAPRTSGSPRRSAPAADRCPVARRRALRPAVITRAPARRAGRPPGRRPRRTAGLWLATTTATAAARAATQQVEDLGLGRGVELAGRLVGEHHGRVVGQRHRQPGAGRLAAGQLARVGPAPGPRARPRRAPRRRPPWPRRGVRRLRRSATLAATRQVVEQVPRLRHSTPMRRAAHPRPAPARAGGSSAALDQTVPPSGSSSPARQRSSVDLPDPDGPDHAPPARPRPRQRHAVQGEGLLVARAVEAVQRPCRDGALRVARVARSRCHRSESVTIRHGSTLSAPCGPDRVSTTSPAALARTRSARRRRAPTCRSPGSTAESRVVGDQHRGARRPRHRRRRRAARSRAPSLQLRHVRGADRGHVGRGGAGATSMRTLLNLSVNTVAAPSAERAHPSGTDTTNAVPGGVNGTNTWLSGMSPA